MNTTNFEKRLEQAAKTAAPRRSVADDVLLAIQQTPKPIRQSRWRWPLTTGLAAASGIAAAIAIAMMLMGTGANLTLADVQAAFERESWVHIKYDAGSLKEAWMNLRTGESYTVHFFFGDTRDVTYSDPRTNTHLWYVEGTDHIHQYSLPGKNPEPWTPHTAWEAVVKPYEQAAEQGAKGEETVVREDDILDGKKVVRFDHYGQDAMGKRLLINQLWVDPATRLPLQDKRRLHSSEREQEEGGSKEWSTGVYEFPQTGPADIYALGVPKGTPIRTKMPPAPNEVQPILEAIYQNRDGFLKHYRAVVTMKQQDGRVSDIKVIWRDGKKFRQQDYHVPAFPEKLADMKASELLALADKHEPIQKYLITDGRAYDWTAGGLHSKEPREKPYVHVYLHQGAPLVNGVFLPESILWSLTHPQGTDFQLIETGSDTPTGCVGLRKGTASRDRVGYYTDYYFDPQNDYLCIKQIHWMKRGTEWTKTQEWTLEDLHRVGKKEGEKKGEGYVVAGKRRMHSYDYDDSAKLVGEYTTTLTIDLVPMTPADYPATIFDPKSLTTDATVEAY